MNRVRALIVLSALCLAASEATAQTYRVGQRVEASLIDGGVTFYEATVVEVGQGSRAGEFRVRFEDGREEWRKAAGGIQPSAAATAAPAPSRPPASNAYRAGQRVEAALISGGVTRYPATVVAVGQGVRGGQFRVRFEDGRTEWRTTGEIKAASAQAARPAPTAATPRVPRTPGRMPASLPTGEYQCFYADANAFDSDIPGSYAASYMGSFQVLNANTYRYTTGTKLTGRYRYAPTTGQITWLSGSLDGRLFQGQFRPARGADRASIRLRYRDSQGRTAVQHCRKIR